MAEIQYDGIVFNNVTPGQGVPSRFGNGTNKEFSQTLIDRSGVKPFVNAVEIDWNGAQIGES